MKKINPFWMTVCIIAALAAIMLCVVGSHNGVLLASPGGDPQAAAAAFLDALKTGDYAKVNSCLSGYSTLGLEEEPASEEGKILLNAVRGSYDYTLSGECVRNGVKASQKILFTRLDAAKMSAAAEAMTDRDFVSALSDRAQNAALYETSDILDISLEYKDRMWRIIPDDALITALRGGLN